jgi:hypothetical protein
MSVGSGARLGPYEIVAPIGAPRALFPTGTAPPTAASANRRQYAVAKDGKRFLVIVPEQGASSSLITVFVNWLAAREKSP